MRTLRVFESISVDGFFCDDAGSMDWAHEPRADPEFHRWVGGNASSGGALLFGRKTYEQMASFWPTPLAMEQMPEVAKGMNAAKKYVVTRTLAPTWNNTEAIGELEAGVRALKRSTGPSVTVLGSGSITAQLGAAGLVDQYQFVIIPLALGSGRTVFSARRSLKLVDQRHFRCGRVVVTYEA